MTPVSGDVAGNGNDTVTFARAVDKVEVYNASSARLTISDGDWDVYVYPNLAKLCEFGKTSTNFTITATGDWAATPYA